MGNRSGNHHPGKKDKDGNWVYCSAKRHDGNPCQVVAVNPDNGKCRVHGGWGPKGVNHPNFRHGRYSRYMPEQLYETVRALCDDEEYLSLREDVAFIDATIDQTMKQYQDMESLPGPVTLYIMSLLDQKRKLVRTETQRIEAETRSIPAERVMAFVAALIEAVKRHVPDTIIQQAIADDIARLSGGYGTPTRELTQARTESV